MKNKSAISVEDTLKLNPLGRSYYCFCLEQALTSIKQARALVRGDVIERDHGLIGIETLIEDALEAS